MAVKKNGVDASREIDDEPVFAPVTIPPDEPVFAPLVEESIPKDEPFFEPVPAQARGGVLPVDPLHGQTGWDAPSTESERRVDADRRLGRTTPVWAGLGVLAVVVIAALWFSLGRRETGKSVVPTQPAAGVVGSAVLTDTDQPPAASAPTPEATALPETSLSPGMRVVVSNTSGQGIRLRSAPGTASLTLGIYNDGAPFLVLSPGGDYDDYPVEADGYFWYRIRVVDDPTDQLVGWAAGDFLTTGE